jgi:hypothetical protein
MKACVKKSQAMWQYDKFQEDSKDCEQCQEIWNKLRAEDKVHLASLKKHLLDHME